MFSGLSAFPLTPLDRDRFDAAAYAKTISRLAVAGVDSITALGSTGSYAYLSTEERRAAARVAVVNAGGTPVHVGVGALRTSQAVALAEDAEAIGASGVLLAPMTYQPLTAREVLGLYRDVTRSTSLPVIVYDNPGTTHFTFTEDLYAEVAALPGIASIKIPAVPADPRGAVERVTRIRSVIPDTVTIGVSGDAAGARGLLAGCDAWYSVVGGTLPAPALAITRAARSGDAEAATAESARLRPLWDLFTEFGSLRVVAVIAELAGLTGPDALPRPVLGLEQHGRQRTAAVLEQLNLLTPQP